ncbi:hypothetical protein B484DRAFT_448267 [Ochromonadaceae sp. CCMP2298]|nr:hypothetical protein B484DRAFT_448267 [Ochromonadaceae sp. CCMP2298]
MDVLSEMFEARKRRIQLHKKHYGTSAPTTPTTPTTTPTLATLDTLDTPTTPTPGSSGTLGTSGTPEAVSRERPAEAQGMGVGEGAGEGMESTSTQSTEGVGTEGVSAVGESPPPPLELSSVATLFAGAEPLLTNWNGEFQGTLDYVFITPQWGVRSVAVFPRVEGNFANGGDSGGITEAGEITREKGDAGGILGILETRISAPQPSLDWPSDHFMLMSTLELPGVIL